MKVIIHDLNDSDFKLIFTDVGSDITVIANDNPIRNCIGCFGCWVKTPGTCVIRDDYENSTD